MAAQNVNTYRIDIGVTGVFEDHWLCDYASKRALQLEALSMLLMQIDTEQQPASLLADVLWIARDLANELKELVPAVHAAGVRKGQSADLRPNVQPQNN